MLWHRNLSGITVHTPCDIQSSGRAGPTSSCKPCDSACTIEASQRSIMWTCCEYSVGASQTELDLSMRQARERTGHAVHLQFGSRHEIAMIGKCSGVVLRTYIYLFL